MHTNKIKINREVRRPRVRKAVLLDPIMAKAQKIKIWMLAEKNKKQ